MSVFRLPAYHLNLKIKNMSNASKITQIVSRSSRTKDGTRGPLVVFFTTEDHLAGYEVTDKQIDSCHNEGESVADHVRLLAELVHLFGSGELEFIKESNRIQTLNGASWVGFSSVQRCQEAPAVAAWWPASTI